MKKTCYTDEQIASVLRQTERGTPGKEVNHTRVYWLLCEEGLNLRIKRLKRRVNAAHRVMSLPAAEINESWSMDFFTDSLFNSRRFRSLTVVDNSVENSWR